MIDTPYIIFGIAFVIAFTVFCGIVLDSFDSDNEDKDIAQGIISHIYTRIVVSILIIVFIATAIDYTPRTTLFRFKYGIGTKVIHLDKRHTVLSDVISDRENAGYTLVYSNANYAVFVPLKKCPEHLNLKYKQLQFEDINNKEEK